MNLFAAKSQKLWEVCFIEGFIYLFIYLLFWGGAGVFWQKWRFFSVQRNVRIARRYFDNNDLVEASTFNDAITQKIFQIFTKKKGFFFLL